MNLRQIKLFVAIANQGSFSAGAEAVSLTQSTVSQHIAALEEEVGVPLFDRLGRGVVLTSAGKLFLRHARRVLGESDALLQAMHGFRGLAHADLVVGASNIPANYLIPPLLVPLKREHPGISLTMLTGDTADVLRMLENAEAELALVGSRSESRAIGFEPLMNDPLVLVVAPSHRWAQQGRIGIEALIAEPLVMREVGSGSGESLEQALQLAGHDRTAVKVAARLGSNEAVLRAVASGCGGAFVSDMSVQHWHRAGEICRVEVEGLVVDRKIWLAWLRGRTLSPAAEVFAGLLKKRYLKGKPGSRQICP